MENNANRMQWHGPDFDPAEAVAKNAYEDIAEFSRENRMLLEHLIGGVLEAMGTILYQVERENSATYRWVNWLSNVRGAREILKALAGCANAMKSDQIAEVLAESNVHNVPVEDVVIKLGEAGMIHRYPCGAIEDGRIKWEYCLNDDGRLMVKLLKRWEEVPR